jgi:diguanylate cyclase (GGDEF)-like protein
MIFELDISPELENKKQFMLSLHNELVLATRNNMPLTFLIAEIDNLESIEADYGPVVKEEVIQRFVSHYRLRLRDSDFFYRLGDRKFSAILTHTNLENAVSMIKRIRETLGEIEIETLNTTVKFTVSTGITKKYEGEDSAQKILNRLDEALMGAKKAGYNRVFVS